MTGMRTKLAFGVTALLAMSIVSGVGCRKTHRYDGTCKEDSHCLEFQKCAEGVCVRKAPILPQAANKARPESPSQARMRKAMTAPPFVPEPLPVQKEAAKGSGIEVAPDQQQFPTQPPAADKDVNQAAPTAPAMHSPSRRPEREATRFRIDA